MCEVKNDIDTIFSVYAQNIEKEAEAKENVILAAKELERTAYSSFTILEKVHHTEGLQVIRILINKIIIIIYKIYLYKTVSHVIFVKRANQSLSME